MGITQFHILTTVVCFLLAMIWKASTWPNILLKVTLYIIAIWGVVVCLYDFGIVIKQ